MKDNKTGVSNHRKWAEFRLSVIGSLLAAPPEYGGIKSEIAKIASKHWNHPISGEPTKFSSGTIERWYYLARNSDNPVDDLMKKFRGDKGNRSIDNQSITSLITQQYKDHPTWSKLLHYDNLQSLIKEDKSLGSLPSYSTFCRWMSEKGLFQHRKKRSKEGSNSGEYRSMFDSKETRSFEAPYPGSLWHLDFHHARRRVLTSDGRWITPILLAIMDDHSRFACHLQWYEGEATGHLVHGFFQALQKRGKPQSLLTDNGSAMIAAEFTEGLKRISVDWHHTLPYCPEQNGKQERFFSTLEGRLMSMLENKEGLTLTELNNATIAWMEMEYNRNNHREIGTSPFKRFFSDKNIHREAPKTDVLTLAFTRQRTRSPRRFDSTLSIEGVRFELPWPYRHLKKVIIRYAMWDLSIAWLMDLEGEKQLAKLFPQDKTANYNNGRRSVDTQLKDNSYSDPPDEIAPLLKKMMADYAATGLPPAYITKEEVRNEP